MKKTMTKKTAKTGRKRVEFHLKADPGSEIYLSGSFNDWSGKAKKMIDRYKSGEYAATLFLAPGKHEYKYLVNGEWHVDPECPNWVVNDCGTLNSVITVAK